jgi:hypothetical protein
MLLLLLAGWGEVFQRFFCWNVSSLFLGKLIDLQTHFNFSLTHILYFSIN